MESAKKKSEHGLDRKEGPNAIRDIQGRIFELSLEKGVDHQAKKEERAFCTRKTAYPKTQR